MLARVRADGAAARAGLRSGDVLVGVNGRSVEPDELLYPLVYGIKGEQPLALSIRRGTGHFTRRFQPPAAPLERHIGLSVDYGVLRTTDGHRLRTIVTRPRTEARHPAIYFIQWTSCDSIDGPLADDDGWKRMIEGLVRRSNMVVWRTDKAGAGDSSGRCEDLDWESEVRHHREAYDRLASLPFVDPERLFIVGGSIGARMAPLVADGRRPAGIVIWGGGAVSWFEYVLQHNRHFSLLQGAPPETLHGKLLDEARILTKVLRDGEDPANLSRSDRAVWMSIPFVNPRSGKLYNRPVEWHRQAAKADWVGAWRRTTAPVLITFGEYDRFDTLLSVEWVRDLVNARRSGQAQLVLIPQMDHHFSRFVSQQAADRRLGGSFAPDPFLNLVIPWLHSKSRPRDAATGAGASSAEWGASSRLVLAGRPVNRLGGFGFGSPR